MIYDIFVWLYVCSPTHQMALKLFLWGGFFVLSVDCKVCRRKSINCGDSKSKQEYYTYYFSLSDDCLTWQVLWLWLAHSLGSPRWRAETTTEPKGNLFYENAKIRNEKMLIIQKRHEQPHYITFSGQKKMDLLFVFRWMDGVLYIHMLSKAKEIVDLVHSIALSSWCRIIYKWVIILMFWYFTCYDEDWNLCSSLSGCFSHHLNLQNCSNFLQPIVSHRNDKHLLWFMVF